MTLSLPAELTTGASATDGTTYTTAAVSLTNNSRVLVLTLSGLSSAAASPASVVHSSIGNLKKIAEIATNNSSICLTAWSGLGNGQSGTFTITHAVSQSNCSWKVLQLTSDIAPPTVKQFATATLAATGIGGAQLPASPNSTSCVLGALGYNAGAAQVPTVGAGFTAIGSLVITTAPVGQLGAEYDSTAPPDTATWSAPNTSGRAFITLEIADGVATSTSPRANIWENGVEVPVTLSIWNGSAETPVILV